MDDTGSGQRSFNARNMGATADHHDLAGGRCHVVYSFDHAFRAICGKSGDYQLVDDGPELLLRTSYRLPPSAKQVDRHPNAKARDQAVHFRNEFSRTLWLKVAAKDCWSGWLVTPNWCSTAKRPATGADHLGFLVDKIASQDRIVWNFDDQLIGVCPVKRHLESTEEISIVEVRSSDDEEAPHRLTVR